MRSAACNVVVQMTLCQEPTKVADQVMLVLDQVAKVKGAKNDKGEVLPLSEEKKRLNYNLLVQATILGVNLAKG